jgi:uracil-DNA glycosylase
MSLHLDDRQRAMLHAMGVVLWQPAAAPDSAENIEPKQPQTQQKRAQAAPDFIASDTPANVDPALHAHTAQRSAAAFDAALPPAADRATSTAAHTAAHSAVSLAPLPAGIAAMDWLQLQQAVVGCRACTLCASRKNTVFGVGAAPAQPTLAPQADWLIVGEAPGEHEDIQGEPFVGQAGKLLDNMLRAMRGRSDAEASPVSEVTASDDHHSARSGAVVFIANVLKCRPPANRNPSPEEMAMCQPYLHRQITLLRPKIIVAMGRFAVQTLLQSTDPIGKLRGRVHRVQIGGHSAPVVVTYHPAYLLRNLPDKAKAWQDLVLAMQTLHAAPD